jgi:carboxymethylenebutenolidase
MGKDMQLKAADGHAFTAYVSEPQGQANGAVVVLQEIFGVNGHIRSVADGYAQAGYLAVAPDLFSRVAPGTQLGYTPEDVQAGGALKMKVEALGAAALHDIQAAVDFARGAGKVGTVGYCWGGLQSWRAACGVAGVSAAVSYYGGGTASPAEIGKTPRVPVLAHFGEQDHLIPLSDVERFRAAHPEVQVHVYPCGHGFNCDQRAAWHAEASKSARERTLAFFSEHLAA